MYQTGELIKFSPFVFKNGNQPKPKYCIVLGQIDDKVMMVSLPTSKDHVPSDVTLERGCVDIPERGVNAFLFSPSDQVTSSFRFPRPTFVYGEQVDEYEQKYLDEMGGTVVRLGQIDPVMFQAIKDLLRYIWGGYFILSMRDYGYDSPKLSSSSIATLKLES